MLAYERLTARRISKSGWPKLVDTSPILKF